MDLAGVAVTLATGLAGAAATYGALAARLTRAEKDIEAVNAQWNSLRNRMDQSRESQGERIGSVEDRVSEMKGQCQAILTILGEEVRAGAGTLPARVRRSTKPPSSNG